MADHHERPPLICIQGTFELSNAHQVEVVGRLVEKKQLRGRIGEENARQCSPQSFTARECSDGKMSTRTPPKEEARQDVHAFRCR